jgi:plastocyanin
VRNSNTKFLPAACDRPDADTPNPLCYDDCFPEPIEMKRLPAHLAACLALAALPLAAANVTGKVAFVSKRGQNPVPAETLVWLEPLGGKIVRRAPAAFQIVTRNKTLVPHILAIPVGSTVAFPNDDPISHNLFSLSSNNAFDLGLYRKGAGKTQKFEKPGVVNVYCNVHPNMSAVIHVMSTPYYGFADANGRYSFDVPPGRYRVIAWNEQGGTSETTVDVGPAGAAMAALTIDSRNFRVSQHMNKMGKPYQAGTREY